MHPSQNCSYCDHSCYSVSWKESLAGTMPNMQIGGNGLVFVKNLKTGFLYQCKTCKSHWYLDSKKEELHIVPEKKYSLLQTWNEKTIVLSETNINTLKQIGTVFPLGRRCKGQFTIPCCVETISGSMVDFALVSFQLVPPIDNIIKKEFSADKIKTIFSSEYAIPLKIRRIASSSPEIQMGASPTHILMNDGAEFIICGNQNFLKHNEYKGCDIIEADNYFNYGDLPPGITEDMNFITSFFADWSEDLFQLFGGQI